MIFSVLWLSVLIEVSPTRDRYRNVHRHSASICQWRATNPHKLASANHSRVAMAELALGTQDHLAGSPTETHITAVLNATTPTKYKLLLVLPTRHCMERTVQ